MSKNKLDYISLNSLTGKLLVSSPAISDNRFYKSIILITKHDSSGATGIVLNKISAHKFSHIIKSTNILIDETAVDLNEQNINIVLGGPVNSNNLFIIHSNDYQNNDTIKITDSIYMTNHSNIIEDIAKNKGAKNSIISIGCATWSANQLEYELLSNTWFILEPEKSSIFEIPTTKLYDELFVKTGFLEHENNPAMFLTKSFKC
ncbi:MAG: YqgE/AlgH family protein [Alphaproteobacteria bacterium]|jgi:putative transcriptional regulator|nr:YqgE/AlgH family protein [Alphaproteobacteria bacterium]